MRERRTSGAQRVRPRTGSSPTGGSVIAVRFARSSGGRGLALGAVVGLLSALIVLRLTFSHPVSPCAFEDGEAYCSMASGGPAPIPFSRRLLVPAVVSWLPGSYSLTGRFQAVAVTSVLVMIIGAMVLTRRLMPRSLPPGVRTGAAIVAASLTAVAPHTLRLALSWPALVDQAATALGLVWLLLVLTRVRVLVALSPFVAFATVAAREAWALPLLVVAAILWHRGRRLAAALTGCGAIAAVLFGLLRPHASGGYSTVRAILGAGKAGVTNPFGELWALVFAVGIVSVLGLLTASTLRRGEAGAYHVPVIAVIGSLLFEAVLTGSDVSRLASGALPFALALGVSEASRRTSLESDATLAVLTLASLLLWQPLRVLKAGDPSYLSYYYPRATASAMCAVLVALGLALTYRLWRAEAATPARQESGPQLEAHAR